MKIWKRRSRWVVEADDGRRTSFATEVEAKKFAGVKEKPLPVEKPYAKKEKGEAEGSKEKTNTYQQKTVRFSQGYDKTKV